MSYQRYEHLPHVLWIGGPAGAGKTTATRRLARRNGLRWYNYDAQTWQHLDRAVAAGVRNAERFAALTPEQRKVARPEEIEYERGPLIIEDLRALPGSPLIVVDSAPPDPAAAGAGQAVWLLPSQAVQRARLQQRHPRTSHNSASGPPRRCSTANAAAHLVPRWSSFQSRPPSRR